MCRQLQPKLFPPSGPSATKHGPNRGIIHSFDEFSIRHISRVENHRANNLAQDKSMLTRFSGANHSIRTSGGALCIGADGPRPGAGRSATWCEARVSCLTVGRSARAQGRRKIADGAWISLPGGTLSGRRDPR
jgi:hypothetical protein